MLAPKVLEIFNKQPEGLSAAKAIDIFIARGWRITRNHGNVLIHGMWKAGKLIRMPRVRCTECGYSHHKYKVSK